MNGSAAISGRVVWKRALALARAGGFSLKALGVAASWPASAAPTREQKEMQARQEEADALASSSFVSRIPE